MTRSTPPTIETEQRARDALLEWLDSEVQGATMSVEKRRYLAAAASRIRELRMQAALSTQDVEVERAALVSAAENVANFAWSAVTADCAKSRDYLNGLLSKLRLALSDHASRSAAQPVDEGQIEQLAAIVHEARFPDGRAAPNYTTFDEEDQGGKEYCRRIARAIIATRPPASGVAEEGWWPIEEAPKDGRMLWLAVDYSRGENEADHPLADAIIAATLGFNQFDDNGIDEWKFAGWCWTNDHFTEGRGRVIAFREIGFDLGLDGVELPAPPALATGDRG